MMRVLDLFSGIGAFSLGLERAGAKIVAFCENQDFCRHILRMHWPEVPIIEDIHHAAFPEADIICGGFPCQDVSRAGRRAGLAGANSGLFWELVRALRLVRPTHAIVENVAALLDDGMGTVLGEMAESGFDAEWDCVPTNALGAPHERDRVWIVAHSDSEWRRSGSGRQAQSSRDEFGRCAKVATADANSQRCGETGRIRCVEELGPPECAAAHIATNASGERCGQGRQGRPPDSFARIRDEARRNAADPYGARLAFRAGLGRDAWEELTAAQRSGGEDVGQSIWPDEPALQGVDDAAPDWMDRTKATGNTLDWLIPYLIGLTLDGVR